MEAALNRLKTAFRENRRILLWLVVTYIPAVISAGYLSFWLLHTYILGFIVGGGYMVGLVSIWLRMLMAVRDR